MHVHMYRQRLEKTRESHDTHLLHVADLLAPPAHVELANVHLLFACEHGAVVAIVESLDEAHDGRLATTADAT